MARDLPPAWPVISHQAGADSAGQRKDILPSSLHSQPYCCWWDINGNYLTAERIGLLCKQFTTQMKIKQERRQMLWVTVSWLLCLREACCWSSLGNFLLLSSLSQCHRHCPPLPVLCGGLRVSFLHPCFGWSYIFKPASMSGKWSHHSFWWAGCSSNASPYLGLTEKSHCIWSSVVPPHLRTWGNEVPRWEIQQVFLGY